MGLTIALKDSLQKVGGFLFLPMKLKLPLKRGNFSANHTSMSRPSANLILHILVWLTLGLNSFPLYAQKPASNPLTGLIEELKAAREAKDNNRLADAYYQLALYEEEVNKSTEVAFDYFISAKQYYDLQKNTAQSNKINRIIARRYAKSGFSSESISLYENLINYYLDNNDEKTASHIYHELSLAYRLSGDNEKALNALNNAIKLNKKYQDTILHIDLNFAKIVNYLHLNEVDSALITAATNFKLSSARNDKSRMSRSLYYIGHANYLRKDYLKANKYLLSSLSVGDNLPYDEERRDTYRSLAAVSAARSLHKEAYDYSMKLNRLNDSILNYDRIKAINDLSIKHQADEKSKDIRILEIENKSVLQKILLTRSALYFVAAGFFLLLVALYFIIRFYSEKIKAEKIMNEQQHEIDQQKIRELEDNIKISSMQSMIVGQEKERQRIAVDLHDSLGGLLSAVKLQFDNVRAKLNGYTNLDQYQNATKLLDTAVEEVRNISRNLQPGALKELGLISAIKDLINRFEGEAYPEIFFQYYNIDDKLDDMTALSIYRIIQELINNTIKHAGANEILIQLSTEQNDLVVEYEDDGKGFDPEHLAGKKGMGVDNIQSRVNYLKGSLSFSSKENEGVSYLIRIPYKKEAESHV